MNIESEIFKRCHVNYDKLISYGFIEKENGYYYSKKFLNDAFEARIKVDKTGNVTGKVMDLELDEEYFNIRIEAQTGVFVNSVKEEYQKILEDIKEKCFNKDYFIFNQSNRVANYIKNKYETNPEFLWSKFPGFGIFRNTKNNKWYAIIMNLDKAKLGNEKGETEIINLKVDVNKINSLLSKPGFYKAYHMNKKDWITITLDDTIDYTILFSLIDESWDLINEKAYWLIPANPKYYDVVNIFNNTSEAIWKQSSDIYKDDIIYLYVASPYSCVLFKCCAIDVKIPFNYEDKNVKMKYVVKLKLLKRYEKDEITFAKLNKLGIKMIRGPRKISKIIAQKMES